MSDQTGAPVWPCCKRLVAKVGSSTLLGPDGALDEAFMGRLAAQISQLFDEGIEVVLVTSGAIAASLPLMGFESKPSDIPTLQACAAVGQVGLIETYSRVFASHGRTVGQILLTRNDTGDRSAYLHARATIERLLSLGAVPIVNENDTVAVTELMFTDNDELSGLIAQMMQADVLVLLSNIDGIYTGDPHAPASRLLTTVRPDDDLSQYIKEERSAFGRGGMHSKYTTARRVQQSGIRVLIANGERPDVLCQLIDHPENVPHTEFIVCK